MTAEIWFDYPNTKLLKCGPILNLPASAGEIPSEAIVSAKSYA